MIAQRIVVDHMRSYNLEAHALPITKSLLGHVKEASSRYRISQKEKAQLAVKNDRDLKLQELNAEILKSIKMFLYYKIL